MNRLLDNRAMFSCHPFSLAFSLLSAVLIVASFCFYPLPANAVTSGDSLLDTIGEGLSLLVPIVVGLGVLFFLWGLALYVLSARDETKKVEGRRIMIWGIITLFVMVSVWGLVELVQNTLQIESEPAPPVPGVVIPNP